VGIQLASQFGAMTASITFADTSIGELQNVSWDESTNIVRVKAIGAPIDIAHLHGATEYTITASRALLDGDVMITLMQGTLSLEALKGVTSTSTTLADAKSVFDSNPLQYVYNALTNSNYGLSYSQAAPGSNKVLGLTFGVLIKDIDGNGVFQFDECTIQSKRHRLDVNGIIVMQDVTLWSRKKVPINTSTVITNANPTK